MMMTANLVGFVIGTDGISYLFSQLVAGWEGAVANHSNIPCISDNDLSRFPVPVRCLCMFIHCCSGDV